MKDRLKEDIVASGRFGREPERRVDTFDKLDPEKGVTRPTGSEANRKVRAYAVEKMKKAGLEVRVDAVGNIFGRKNGTGRDGGAVMCGSHLDSVINGGQLDGALGVFSAIEAVRRLNDEGYENRRPIEVAVFTGEEGSVFGMTLLGSTAFVGKMSFEEALARQEPEGRTLREALEYTGYAGDFTMDLDNVEYFVELHIEQGSVLFNNKVPIGIVENIAGIAWVNATIKGEGNHAGTTPMKMRRDALVAAADTIRFVEKQANEMVDRLGSATVGTVGKLNVYPNGTNIVPGRVELGIDIRDVVFGNMESLKQEVLEALKALEKKYGVSVDITLPPTHSPEPLAPEVVDIIEKSARDAGIRAMRMNSGAGHDSQNTATRLKTGMIFVPSVRGISHAPMEWTEWADIENGARGPHTDAEKPVTGLRSVALIREVARNVRMSGGEAAAPQAGRPLVAGWRYIYGYGNGMNKKKLMKELGERAYSLGYEYEKKYHGCAQCIAAAVQDTFGIRNDDIFKSMTGFGGGGGGLCNRSCGAYAGGTAILSWLAGRERAYFEDIDVSRAYDLTRRLHSRFIEKYGTIICRDINMKIFSRPFYTADPDEYSKFQAAGSYEDKCTDVVGLAAQWVAELIIDRDLVQI